MTAKWQTKRRKYNPSHSLPTTFTTCPAQAPTSSHPPPPSPQAKPASSTNNHTAVTAAFPTTSPSAGQTVHPVPGLTQPLQSPAHHHNSTNHSPLGAPVPSSLRNP